MSKKEIESNERTELITPVKFAITSEEIAIKRAEYGQLSAENPAGYALVRSAIADCRNTRAKIEARRKELKAGALSYGRTVDGAAKELTGLIESFEGPLKEKKQAVDDEKLRVKREKEEAQRRAVEEKLRIEREAEEARLAEIKAVEDARIKAEQDAERARVEAERVKLEEEREEMRSEREAFEEERRLANEKLRAEREKADDEKREADRAEQERAAEVTRLEEIEREKLDQERREIEAQKAKMEQAEAERVEAARKVAKAKAQAKHAKAMKPDLEKIAAFRAEILELSEAAPELKTSEAKDELELIVCKLRGAAGEIPEPSFTG